jgi:FkbH-like protein
MVSPSLPEPTIETNNLDLLPEPVRLIVWDLDETFWRGTLSEGGVEHVEAHERIVIELARRGIVSSICSKNDAAAAIAQFAGREVMDYWIFPQIDWNAKGPKLKALVEAVNLRPASILFIDDNHMMRQEAAHFVPGLQVADETVIPLLLDHPMFRGKPDPELTRLKQYKLLEQRHAAAGAGSGSTDDFLRDSGIVVEIDYDVEAHIDRAIDLINRTNQLNFTKIRLPDDLPEARAILIEILRRFNIQSGLIRVRDRYGDYGYVGLYVEEKSVHPGSHLFQFCFSCRILGMKIETWLYRRLGRPPINITGEVVSDILETDSVIDWISIGHAGSGGVDTDRSALPGSAVLLRGGCEVLPLEHYCEQIAETSIAELAYNREGVQLRIEHSQFGRYAIDPPPMEAMESFRKLGYRDSDFESQVFSGAHPEGVRICSFWSDLTYRLYKHRATGAVIPFSAFPAASMHQDLTRLNPDALSTEYRQHWVADALAHLAEEYEDVGCISEADYKANLTRLFAAVPSSAPIFVIGINELPSLADAERGYEREWQKLFNRYTREVSDGFTNVHFLAAADYLREAGDYEPAEPDHYSRLAYYRIFRIIIDRLTADSPPSPAATGPATA